MPWTKRPIALEVVYWSRIVRIQVRLHLVSYLVSY